MDNINLIQVRGNYWMVKADTKRFGKQAILFEGTYDEGMFYIMFHTLGTGAEKVTIHVTGEKDGVRFDNDRLTVHRNGFIEQDWDKLFKGVC